MDKPFAFPIPDIDYLAVLPILLVIGTGIVALIVELVRPKENNNLTVMVALGGLVLAGAAAALQFKAVESETLGNMVVNDRFGLVIQLLLIVACFLSILFSEGYLREKRIAFGEFYPLVLWSTSGAMIMSTSKNLLVIFLGLEILSIALYVMAGMSRQEQKSEESALKYFLLGAFASGFLLYGIAMFYGATGSLHLDAMPAAWGTGVVFMQALLLFGLGLMLVGFCFKSAFVPFHQWTPDVYQGAPTNVTAFMAAGSKIAAIAALWRVLDAASPMLDYWLPALTWVAILTMTVGNVVALLQKDIKRILGYSSIAHAGYILVAVLAHFKDPQNVGISTVAYYLLAYTLMTVGSFAIVTLTAKGGKETTRMEDLHGLWLRAPGAAIALVIFMVSLIGIPPTAGFIGKYMIFQDAISADLYLLAIVLAINSAISIYYYLGIAYAAFVVEEEAKAPLASLNAGFRATTAVCAAGLILAAVLTYPLLKWIGPSTAQRGSALRAGAGAARSGSQTYRVGEKIGPEAVQQLRSVHLPNETPTPFPPSSRKGGVPNSTFQIPNSQ